MTFKGELREFQEDALQRMLEEKQLLVALEKGLGKTVVSIAAVETLIDQGLVSSGFVIASNSLKGQWLHRIEEFSGGDARVLVVDGTPQRRVRLYAKYMERECEYLIINYDQLVNDWDIIRKLPRDFIIADEITAIKNFTPKRSRRLKKFTAQYRWGLTGQPVENRAEDVFSIMQWIDDDLLGDFPTFDQTFIVRNPWGQVKKCINLPTLRRLLDKRMVRVSREEVADQMPAIVEQSLILDIDPVGANLYRTIAKELLDDLHEAAETFGGGSFDILRFYNGDSAKEGFKMQGQIMSKLMCLRMLCDHPDLLKISADHFKATEPGRAGSRAGSAYAAELVDRGLLKKTFKHPKLDATLEEIELILEADPKNKVVLFSYFKDMLRIIQAEFAKKKLEASVLFTGDMNVKQRDDSKLQFANDPDTRLFLSSDAGGYGLDLPMANYLISYDLPWSAGSWDQRNSRIIRLSSEFPEITLTSMLVEQSIEQWQYDKVASKMRLGAAITDGKGIDKLGHMSLDLGSLTDFLENSEI